MWLAISCFKFHHVKISKTCKINPLDSSIKTELQMVQITIPMRRQRIVFVMSIFVLDKICYLVFLPCDEMEARCSQYIHSQGGICINLWLTEGVMKNELFSIIIVKGMFEDFKSITGKGNSRTLPGNQFYLKCFQAKRPFKLRSALEVIKPSFLETDTLIGFRQATTSRFPNSSIIKKNPNSLCFQYAN